MKDRKEKIINEKDKTIYEKDKIIQGIQISLDNLK